MRRAAKVDANQASIVTALRKLGATVQSLAAVGAGVPDLLIGYREQTLLVEVKDGAKVASAQRLTEAQTEWHARWRGAHVHVVRSVAEALALVGVR